MNNAILTGKLELDVTAILFAVLLMVFTPLASSDFSEGLVLHHSYDEGQGSLAADSSGNGHDGEIHACQGASDYQKFHTKSRREKCFGMKSKNTTMRVLPTNFCSILM